MSKWRSLPNLTAQAVTVLEQAPWNYSSPRPSFEDKETFRKWCLDSQTKHLFFTPVEATNARVRVATDNPPFRMHGFVADFDGKTDLGTLKQRLEADLPPELRPLAIGQTFSGGARVAWEFDSPVWVDNHELATAFLKLLATELKLAKLAPGYDPASQDLSQTWELGGPWYLVDGSQPIPGDRLTSWQMKAALKVKRVKTDLNIPLEVVFEEIQRQYPGRLPNVTHFQPGTRIPLFWVPDGIPDLSAIVSEWGVYSFSTRSDKGMMFWNELLGQEFVAKYQAKRVHDAIENFWWDINGGHYWYLNGAFTPINKDNLTQDLKVKGYSAKTPEKKTCNEIDEIQSTIRELKKVDAAAPFTHTKERLVHWNGEWFLNIRNKHPMNPAPSTNGTEFPWLAKYFANFLSPHPTDTIHPTTYFYAELQRAYRAVLEGVGRSGHALIFAGPTGRGKSFLTTNIFRCIFGSAADAGDYFMGKTNFNKELVKSHVWYVDDQESSIDIRQHVIFTERLKKHVATPAVNAHPKNVDSKTIPWYGRIVATCNDDPESITMIPSLDRSTLDKFCLFQVSDWQAEFRGNPEMEALLDEELPFFLRWLLDHFVPDEVLDHSPAGKRYGIVPYQHAGLVRASYENAPDLRWLELLEVWLEQMAAPSFVGEDGHPYWTGYSPQLLAELQSANGPLSGVTRGITVNSWSRFLNKIWQRKIWPHLVGRAPGPGTTTLWKIRIPQKPAAKLLSV